MDNNNRRTTATAVSLSRIAGNNLWNQHHHRQQQMPTHYHHPNHAQTYQQAVNSINSFNLQHHAPLFNAGHLMFERTNNKSNNHHGSPHHNNAPITVNIDDSDDDVYGNIDAEMLQPNIELILTENINENQGKSENKNETKMDLTNKTKLSSPEIVKAN